MRNDGKLVELQRKRAGLTKTELAKRIGVSASAVFYYERTKTLGDDVVKKLQGVFGSDWSLEAGVYVLPQGIEAVTKLLKEHGVTVRIEGKLIYFI